MRWLLSLASVAFTAAISCISDSGNSVDTWLIIKEPHSTSYLYADPLSELQLSQYSSLNFTDRGALALTSDQLWSADSYVIYNDEDPVNSTYSYNYGHTKGYLFFNDDISGIWIQHSIPQFPVGPGFTVAYNGLTHNARTNAQHIYCMSLTAETLNTVSGILLLNKPRINDWKLSAAAGKQFGNISSLVAGKYSTEASCKSVTVKTVGGQEHTVFGKSAEWGKALWDDCVASAVSENLLVQSWLQGNALGPSCPTSGFTVQDIQSVKFGNLSWDTGKDHSKWAVGIDGRVACFGDINRVYSQAERGGGAVCTSVGEYTIGLSDAVAASDSC
jgi:hypothetical protein